MSFLIKKTSQSFKYLSYWKNNYKRFAETGNRLDEYGYDRKIATDYCSYYRTVFKLMLVHFCILLLIPSTLIGILIVTGNIYITPTLTLTSVCWIIAASPSIIAIVMASVGVAIWFTDEICPIIVNYIRQKLPEPKMNVKNSDKSPGILETWYEGFKGNFCHTINFEVETDDQVANTK